jgi:hypothetical protein
MRSARNSLLKLKKKDLNLLIQDFKPIDLPAEFWK